MQPEKVSCFSVDQTTNCLNDQFGINFLIDVDCVHYSRLNFGLIAVTMFVSMWISNTAAVAMMIPIMQAVLEELESVSLSKFMRNLNDEKPKIHELNHFFGSSLARTMQNVHR